jgi:hypothetical protein
MAERRITHAKAQRRTWWKDANEAQNTQGKNGEACDFGAAVSEVSLLSPLPPVYFFIAPLREA